MKRMLGFRFASEKRGYDYEKNSCKDSMSLHEKERIIPHPTKKLNLKKYRTANDLSRIKKIMEFSI